MVYGGYVVQSGVVLVPSLLLYFWLWKYLSPSRWPIRNLVSSLYLLVPDAAIIATAQSRDDLTHELHGSAGMIRTDGDAQRKLRCPSRFPIRESLGRVFHQILHTGDTLS